MKLTITPKRKNEYLSTYRYRQIKPADGVCVSSALICLRCSRFGGKFIPSMTVADVSTLPDYRNRGLVRGILTEAHQQGAALGAFVSILHPFSFDFYRKFGYEKVSDTVTLRFPLASLSPLNTGDRLTPLTKEYEGGLLSLFRDFTRERNLCLDRYDIATFLRKRADTLLLRKGDDLLGYVICEKNQETETLFVSELGFRTEMELKRLLSALVAYGQGLKTLVFADAEPIPELYRILGILGCDLSRESRGDLAARILNTEEMLRANRYPKARGHFVIRVEDDMESVRGCFEVTYEDGLCAVQRLPFDSATDLSVTAPALARLLYGHDIYTKELAEQAVGVTLFSDASDFFRAFPKRICGLFEHF